ncbi:hypothetical protein FA13DRAFT_1729126 [Coprinellus micaceus]|uniref:Uncharacterized protein n=1 Tax=Coprinellus micaceus TaxID=71717 RepID=A0A4Y7TKN1_COPMI|nr:hypothetical protein FA13DRAFT_1729126 [Coprinellus micaceus]
MGCSSYLELSSIALAPFTGKDHPACVMNTARKNIEGRPRIPKSSLPRRFSPVFDAFQFPNIDPSRVSKPFNSFLARSSPQQTSATQ